MMKQIVIDVMWDGLFYVLTVSDGDLFDIDHVTRCYRPVGQEHHGSPSCGEMFTAGVVCPVVKTRLAGQEKYEQEVEGRRQKADQIETQRAFLSTVYRTQFTPPENDIASSIVSTLYLYSKPYIEIFHRNLPTKFGTQRCPNKAYTSNQKKKRGQKLLRLGAKRVGLVSCGYRGHRTATNDDDGTGPPKEAGGGEESPSSTDRHNGRGGEVKKSGSGLGLFVVPLVSADHTDQFTGEALSV
ncbi:hypothetical protein Btru_056688 [Bulinus truncatus]|nr:hypothetical protein Btru_056688 [Bulinus truncatus]